MVYLEQHIKHLREALEPNNLGSMAYYFYSDKKVLQGADLSSFQGQDLMAAKGYCGIALNDEERDKILKPGFKGIDISSTIFKLIGAYFAHPVAVAKKLAEKFQETSLRNRFFISLLVPEYRERLVTELASSNEPDAWIYKFLLGLTPYSKEHLDQCLDFLSHAEGAIDLVILDEFRKVIISQELEVTKFRNITSKELLEKILLNFQNSTNKITQARRAGRNSFVIKDEYDVQDILYTMLKGIFPLMKEEDPVPRHGVKSSRIDLIIREEGILIEVKMIKETDSNEKEFVEQIKTDIQSYHQSEWLRHLICFVYDPFGKTKDKQNFYDLAGHQTINGKGFSIDIILNP